MRKYLLGSSLALVLVLSANAQNQNPQNPNQAQKNQGIPSQQFPNPIYRMNDVSQSLKLNEDQINRLNQLTTKMQTQFRSDFDKLGTLPEKDRFGKYNELNTRFQTEWMSGARDIFNEQQLNRYHQLQWQSDPFSAFSNPDLQKKLNLTDEQRTKLREQMDWSNQQTTNLSKLQGDAAIKAHTEFLRERQNRVNQFLNQDQQRIWREMTGDPFEFRFNASGSTPNTPKQ